MRHALRLQFVRFLLVGAVNSCIGYAAYAWLLSVGLQYAAASFGALVLGILVSFRTQGALVFGNRDSRRIVRFAASWGVIYLVNIALLGALVWLGLSAYWAGAVALLPIALLSYVIQKYLVFRTARTHSVTKV